MRAKRSWRGVLGRGLGVALGALLAGAVLAQEPQKRACPPPPAQPTPEQVQEAMKNAQDHGYLWRISRDGRTSWLYGTMHVGKLEWMFPGPRVKEALRASDAMALELDVLDPAIQGQMREEMARLKGATLPPALEARLRRDSEALCVPWAALAGSPPELQIVMLDMVAGRAEGLEGAYAVDAALAAVGHASHLQMVSLETPAFQVHALMMKNRDETIAYVEDNLDELESETARGLLKRLAYAWADSDYAQMERYPEWCECLRNDIEREMMKRMLDERNPAMAEKIDALHRSGKRVFAAVGSLHMFGRGGLPALLRQKGYAVERIELAAGRKEAH